MAAIDDGLLPALDRFATAIEARALRWMTVVKTGRTHLQDAVPLTVGQEWSGYAAQVRDAMENLTSLAGRAPAARLRRHRGRDRAERAEELFDATSRRRSRG